MAIYKEEEIIGWYDGQRIYCTYNCGDPGDAMPLLKEDFNEGDAVVCDNCGERIL